MMSTPVAEVCALTVRVEALERANRRLRRWGVAAATLAVAAVLTGALPSIDPRPTIEAQRFVVRDTQGRVRAAFGLRGDGSPSLNFYDRSANTRLVVGLESDTPMLGFIDAKGKGRVQLGLGEDGAPHVSLYDDQEHGRVQLGLGSEGAPSLTLSDRERKAAIWLAIEDELPGLHVQDRRGRLVFKAP